MDNAGRADRFVLSVILGHLERGHAFNDLNKLYESGTCCSLLCRFISFLTLTKDEKSKAEYDAPRATDDKRPSDLADAKQLLILVAVIVQIRFCRRRRHGAVAAVQVANLLQSLGIRFGEEGFDQEGAGQEAHADEGVDGHGEGAGLDRALGEDDEAAVGRDEGSEGEVLQGADGHQQPEAPDEGEDSHQEAVGSHRQAKVKHFLATGVAVPELQTTV